MRVLVPLAVVLSLAPSLAHAESAPAPLQWQVVTLSPPPGAAPSSFAEPGIVIGADGTALADAATANTGAPPTLWLSHDSGSSWTSGQDFDVTGSSTGDADVAVGPDGYLYALDLGFNNPPAQPTNPTVLVFRSQDGGAVWQGPATFPPPQGLDQPDRPWLFVDPAHPADVDVVNSEGGGNIVLWQSHDHGATFAGPIPVSGGTNSQAALALSSRPLRDPSDDQRIFVLYETVTPAGLAAALASPPPLYEFPMGQVWLAMSNDDGSTWSDSLVFDTSTATDPQLQAGTLGHLLVASAVDGAGHLYAAFSARSAAGTQTQIYLTASTDHGGTWSAPVAVAAPTLSNVMPALAVGAGGAAYVSWYGSADPDFRDANAQWFEMFAQSGDPLAAQPAFTVGQVSSTVVHTGGIDTAGNVGFQSGANWGLRDFQSLAVDACGLPHPVWAVDTGTGSAQAGVPVPACTLGTSTPDVAMPWVVVPLTGGILVLWTVRRRTR